MASDSAEDAFLERVSSRGGTMKNNGKFQRYPL